MINNLYAHFYVFCSLLCFLGVTTITDEFYRKWRKISTVEEAYELLNLSYDAKWERKFFSPEGGLVINNPVQSKKESCSLTTVCTPLPYDQRPNHVYFPRCIDLEQCSGFCCDFGNRCLPQSQQTLKVRVKDWLITSTGSSTSQPDLVVEVQKHTGKCQCRHPADSSRPQLMNKRWWFW